MATEGKNNVRISGAGSAGGGVYETVSISGAGRITGDVEAGKISISGAGKIEGSVRAGTFSASGASKVQGDLEAKTAKCSGATKITGGVSVGELKVSGAAKISGNCKAGKAKLLGACKFGSDLEAEQLLCAGAFSVAGLVNADQAEIALGGECRVGEIGGGRITVVQGVCKGGFWPPMWWRREGDLRVETVEGDDIYLEATTASCVRGRRVRIGKGCRVEHVEYSESLEIDPRAEVGDHQHTGPNPIGPIGHDKLHPPDGWAKDQAVKVPGWQGARMSIDLPFRNPVLRVLAAIFGLAVAGIVVFLVLSTVLPVVGVILVIVLGGLLALLLALLVGVPIIVAGAILVKLLLLPLEAIGWLFRRRRHPG